MRYLSLCSGIEAATVGWHPIGWEPVAFSEIDPFPCAVLAHHYPDVPNWGDMTKFKEWPDANVDVLVGGTPCQSFSVAGLRAGLDDPRGNLALVYLAVADRYRPKWLVWENVPGVLSSDGGRAMGSILGAMAKLGYGFAYRVLDAQYVRVDGFGRAVPQRRRRVFVVGCLGDWRPAAAVLFERESLSGNTAPRREAGERPAPSVTSGPPFSRTGNERVEGEAMVSHSLKAEGFDASEDGTGRGTPLVPTVSPTLRAGGNNTGGDRPPGTDVDTCETLIPSVSPALKARDYKGPSSDGDGDGAPILPVAFDARQSDVLMYGDKTGPLDTDGCSQAIAFSCKDHGGDSGETSPTLRAMGHDGSHANAGGQVAVAFDLNQITSKTNRSQPDPAVHHTLPATTCPPHLATPMSVRRLTPKECERLQGLPDSYTAIEYRGKPAKDGPRYKALGNSMACNVMRWIGRRIQMVEDVMSET